MNTQRFEVDARKLVNLIPHVSKDTAHPILHCVYFEAGGVAVATDGFTLLAYTNAHDAEQDVLIEWSSDAIRLAKKVAKAGTKLLVETETYAEDEWADKTATVAYGGMTVPVIQRRGPYPNWRQVIPTGEPKSIPQIAMVPEQGKRFPGKVRLWFFGEDRAMIVESQDEEMFGLWMPVDQSKWVTDLTVGNPHWPQIPRNPVSGPEEMEDAA
jgi:hypothetical protein